MKRLNDFWFGVLLSISILLTCYCFVIAKEQRESIKVGGEVFMIALPLLIVKWKMHTAEQEKIKKEKQYKKTIHELKKQLKIDVML